MRNKKIESLVTKVDKSLRKPENVMQREILLQLSIEPHIKQHDSPDRTCTNSPKKTEKKKLLINHNEKSRWTSRGNYYNFSSKSPINYGPVLGMTVIFPKLWVIGAYCRACSPLSSCIMYVLRYVRLGTWLCGLESQ